MPPFTIRPLSRRRLRPTAVASAILASGVLLLPGCAGSGGESAAIPPALRGTHTVMGRAFFPGGVMVLVEARLANGVSSGRMEYSEVESRGENTFRVEVEVSCLGIFRQGSQAVVTGPVTRVDGDHTGRVNARDWWVLQVEEGREEGDRILSQRSSRRDALDTCQNGPTRAATFRAVDGDLSIL